MRSRLPGNAPGDAERVRIKVADSTDELVVPRSADELFAQALLRAM